VKSTRTTNASVMDHLLSTFVFVAFLVEFLLVKGAAHSVFFTLMVIALVDVLAGFSVSMRAANRDINVN
jgi:predicted Co/Zn/Cd cation transporter (cation efflux family)